MIRVTQEAFFPPPIVSFVGNALLHQSYTPACPWKVTMRGLRACTGGANNEGAMIQAAVDFTVRGSSDD